MMSLWIRNKPEDILRRANYSVENVIFAEDILQEFVLNGFSYSFSYIYSLIVCSCRWFRYEYVGYLNCINWKLSSLLFWSWYGLQNLQSNYLFIFILFLGFIILLFVLAWASCVKESQLTEIVKCFWEQAQISGKLRQQAACCCNMLPGCLSSIFCNDANELIQKPAWCCFCFLSVHKEIDSFGAGRAAQRAGRGAGLSAAAWIAHVAGYWARSAKCLTHGPVRPEPYCTWHKHKWGRFQFLHITESLVHKNATRIKCKETRATRVKERKREVWSGGWLCNLVMAFAIVYPFCCSLWQFEIKCINHWMAHIKKSHWLCFASAWELALI